MQIFKSKHNGLDFCQIYATKDELQNEEIQEKINNIKKSESKVAMFVSGDDEYLKNNWKNHYVGGRKKKCFVI